MKVDFLEKMKGAAVRAVAHKRTVLKTGKLVMLIK